MDFSIVAPSICHPTNLLSDVLKSIIGSYIILAKWRRRLLKFNVFFWFCSDISTEIDVVDYIGG